MESSVSWRLKHPRTYSSLSLGVITFFLFKGFILPYILRYDPSWAGSPDRSWQLLV